MEPEKPKEEIQDGYFSKEKREMRLREAKHPWKDPETGKILWKNVFQIEWKVLGFVLILLYD